MTTATLSTQTRFPITRPCECSAANCKALYISIEAEHAEITRNGDFVVIARGCQPPYNCGVNPTPIRSGEEYDIYETL